MKEVTYEYWQKNPTPRMMWVWDSFENDKKQREVLISTLTMFIVKTNKTKKFLMIFSSEKMAVSGENHLWR